MSAPARLLVGCVVCEREVLAVHEVAADVLCDDCFFDHCGDMLTADELRRLDLREPVHVLAAVEWLAEMERWT